MEHQQNILTQIEAILTTLKIASIWQFIYQHHKLEMEQGILWELKQEQGAVFCKLQQQH